MSNPNPPTPAEIAAVINEPVKTQQPIEIVISPTEKFIADTPQQAIEKLAQAKQQASQHIEKLENDYRTLKQQFEQVQQQRQPQQTPGDPQTNEYFNRWAQNPDEANLQSLARAIGIPPEQAKQVLRSTVEGAVTRTAADEFSARYPNFQATPQNVQLLRQRHVERFGDSVQAATADNLEISLQSLIREGRITLGELPITNVQGQPAPIPNLQGHSAGPNPELEMMQAAYTMPLDELKQKLERAMALQRR